MGNCYITFPNARCGEQNQRLLTSGQTGNIAPAFWGSPHKGTKSEVWQHNPCLLRPSQGSPTREQKWPTSGWWKNALKGSPEGWSLTKKTSSLRTALSSKAARFVPQTMHKENIRCQTLSWTENSSHEKGFDCFASANLLQYTKHSNTPILSISSPSNASKGSVCHVW